MQVDYSIQGGFFSFTNTVNFGPFKADEGIRSYNWITALFLRIFTNSILDVTAGDGSRLYLNKHQFQIWQKNKSQELSCEDECAAVPTERAIHIICAAKYNKLADHELVNPDEPCFEKAIQHLQKASAIATPKKSLYEKRVTDLTQLQKKWDEIKAFKEQPLTLNQSLAALLNEWASRYSLEFPHRPKLERMLTLLSGIERTFHTITSFSNLVKPAEKLVEIGFTDDQIKGCGEYDNSLLEEISGQGASPESKLARKLIPDNKLCVLSKMKAMVQKHAKTILEKAFGEGQASVKNDETEPAIPLEPANKKVEEGKEKALKQAMEFAEKIDKEANELFKKMEFESCLTKLDEAKDLDSKAKDHFKIDNKIFAVKALLKWSTASGVQLNEVKKGIEDLKKQISKDLADWQAIQLGPMDVETLVVQHEVLQKIKSVFVEFVKDYYLPYNIEDAFYSNCAKLAPQVSYEIYDRGLDAIPSDLTVEKDLIYDAKSYHTLAAMSKLSSELSSRTMKIKINADEAISSENRAIELFNDGKFQHSIKLLDNAKGKAATQAHIHQLEILCKGIRDLIFWAEHEHDLHPEDTTSFLAKMNEYNVLTLNKFENLRALQIGNLPIPRFVEEREKIEVISGMLSNYIGANYTLTPEQIVALEAKLEGLNIIHVPLNHSRLDSISSTKLSETQMVKSCKRHQICHAMSEICSGLYKKAATIRAEIDKEIMNIQQSLALCEEETRKNLTNGDFAAALKNQEDALELISAEQKPRIEECIKNIKILIAWMSHHAYQSPREVSNKSSEWKNTISQNLKTCSPKLLRVVKGDATNYKALQAIQEILLKISKEFAVKENDLQNIESQLQILGIEPINYNGLKQVTRSYTSEVNSSLKMMISTFLVPHDFWKAIIELHPKLLVQIQQIEKRANEAVARNNAVAAKKSAQHK